MVGRTSHAETNELTAAIRSSRTSYTIVDHRSAISRIDDEAIVHLEAAIETISERYQSLISCEVRFSLCCSQSYCNEGPGAGGLPPRASLKLRKGGCSGLLYLPHEAFWGLQPHFLEGRFSEVHVTFGKLHYGTAELTSFSLQE